MKVNYYYSDELTNDTEGNLVQLCGACAQRNADKVQWAQRGDHESECEICNTANDPAYSRQLDRIMNRLKGL